MAVIQVSFKKSERDKKIYDEVNSHSDKSAFIKDILYERLFKNKDDKSNDTGISFGDL